MREGDLALRRYKMSEYINLAVPFFSQRENIYTWHEVVTKVKWDATNKKYKI